jgi:hypothetical protein
MDRQDKLIKKSSVIIKKHKIASLRKKYENIHMTSIDISEAISASSIKFKNLKTKCSDLEQSTTRRNKFILSMYKELVTFQATIYNEMVKKQQEWKND